MSLRPKLQLKRRFDYLKFWSYLYRYAGCHISTKFSTTTATTAIYTNVLPSTSTNTNSQRVQTLREYVAVESPILSMLMATKFDQRKKIKNWSKTKEIKIVIYLRIFYEQIFIQLHKTI